jgi:hypothetical protein
MVRFIQPASSSECVSLSSPLGLKGKPLKVKITLKGYKFFMPEKLYFLEDKFFHG